MCISRNNTRCIIPLSRSPNFVDFKNMTLGMSNTFTCIRAVNVSNIPIS